MIRNRLKIPALPLSWSARGGNLQIVKRPLPLMLAAASVAAIANAWVLAAPPTVNSDPETRLGVSLREDMAKRDRTLAEEKRKLDMREQAAKAAEARLAAEMAARKAETEGASESASRRGSNASEPNQPYDDLARIYQTMKPARAAPIFEKLDLETQTQVAKRMRDRATALLMAAMSPSAAADLTMSMAGKTPSKRSGRSRNDSTESGRSSGR